LPINPAWPESGHPNTAVRSAAVRQRRKRNVVPPKADARAKSDNKIEFHRESEC